MRRIDWSSFIIGFQTGLFVTCIILLIFSLLSSSCVSYEQFNVVKPSEVQLEVQEGDDQVVTEDDGITVGELREALKAYEDRKVLEEKQVEDKEYFEGKIDEGNWRIVGLSVLAGVLGVIAVFK